MIMDDNWGLHAIVHGCTHPAQEWNNVVDIEEEIFDMGQHLPFDMFSPSTSFDRHELECGPFCVNDLEMVCGSKSRDMVEMQHTVLHEYELFEESPYLLPVGTNSAFVAAAAASNRAKRKNQQKRVVQHVNANGLSTDLWAWRKYGQKPIKGSFYPRSYYRCSSSKGCAARKQVEQSSLEPHIFTITYTEDHNHPHPTRRSSLSGVSKNKKAASVPPKNREALVPNKDSSSSNAPVLKTNLATPLMQGNTNEDNRIKEECVITKVDYSKMTLGLGFDEEMVFDLDQSWFPHWLDGRSVC